MPIHIYRNTKRRSSDTTTKPTQQRAPPPLATQSFVTFLTNTWSCFLWWLTPLDVLANANSHLQKYKKKKLRHDNKTNPTTGTTTIGDTVICDILDQHMILLSLVIDPLGRFGPILQYFLFVIQPSSPLTFTPVKPNATAMYFKRMLFPSPKGVVNLVDHNWKTKQSHCILSQPTLTHTQTTTWTYSHKSIPAPYPLCYT